MFSSGGDAIASVHWNWNVMSPSIRPSLKSLSDLNEISFVGGGR